MALKDSKFKQGIYTLINPEKYVGKLPLVYRSSWEFAYMTKLDKDDKILQWASESLAISYVNPITGRMSRYYPDFLYTHLTEENKEEIVIVEIKPYKQTIQPSMSTKKSKKTKLTEAKAWLVNNAKWKYAVAYCQPRGIKFKIVTEKDLRF